MATLTIDLPDVPRPQAAYRLAADCPHCGAPLVLRQNRQTGVLFTGCSAYPSCAFAEPHDPRVQTLSTRVVRAVQALATQVIQVQTEAQRQLAQAQADAQRQVAAEWATLDRTVRQLIALAHPDRWPDTPLAHDSTTWRHGDAACQPVAIAAKRSVSPRDKAAPGRGDFHAAAKLPTVSTSSSTLMTWTETLNVTPRSSDHESIPRMVKKLMRLRAHSISAAPQAVRDTALGLRGLDLG